MMCNFFPPSFILLQFTRARKANLVFGKRQKNGVFQIRLNIERKKESCDGRETKNGSLDLNASPVKWNEMQVQSYFSKY